MAAVVVVEVRVVRRVAEVDRRLGAAAVAAAGATRDAGVEAVLTTSGGNCKVRTSFHPGRAFKTRNVVEHMHVLMVQKSMRNRVLCPCAVVSAS